MIPVLFDKSATSFTTNGLGRLTDCVSCNVVEELNGQFELEMIYKVGGQHYADIEIGGIIYAEHDDNHDRQAFRIYRIETPIDELVTINAHHISYDLNGIVCLPYSSSSLAEAVTTFPSELVDNDNFTFTTTTNTTADYSLTEPTGARAMIGESLFETYGFEIEWDNFNVKLVSSRGSESGVTIRNGKNLTDITRTQDSSNCFTAIVGYYANDDTIVTGSQINSDYYDAMPITRVVDFSNEFESTPSVADIDSLATSYMNSLEPWNLSDNIEISFIQLWNTSEYENIAPLQRVGLGDTVTVIHTGLGISASARVISTNYNVLLDRYDEMELGNAKSTLAQTLSDGSLATKEEVDTTKSVLEQTLEHQTELIKGGLGGYVVLNTNADGEPQEILIMDTDDINTAVNVIRMNKNGIAFSNNGYNGPYSTAWTIDSQFSADFIASGTINAIAISGSAITGGTITGTTITQTDNTNGRVRLASGKVASNCPAGSSINITGKTDYINLYSGRIKCSTGDSSSDEEVAFETSSVGMAGYIGGNERFRCLADTSNDNYYMYLSSATSGKYFRADPSGMLIRTSAARYTNIDQLTVDTHTTNGYGFRCYSGSSSSIGGWMYPAQMGTVGTCYAQTFTNTSDANLKENIQTVDGDIVDELNPVSFSWKDGDGKRHLGFIAQEVQATLGDDYAITSQNANGYYGLSYNELIAINTKAIQDLRKQVAELQAEIKSLKGDG